MSLLFDVCTSEKWGEHGLACGSTSGAKQTQHTVLLHGIWKNAFYFPYV